MIWLNWRAAEPSARGKPRAALRLTLHPAGPARPRVASWLGVPVLLAARAIFYWQVGPPVHWNPLLILGPTGLSFRSDMPGRMFLFSLLSFGATLGVFYIWLLALSWLNTGTSDADPTQRLLRLWLGRFERWPGFVKLFLPLAVTTLAWAALHPLLQRMDLAPVTPWPRALAQGAVIGLSAYLTLKFLLAALLVLFLLNNYIYMGDFALWTFVNTTSRRLLRPLEWAPLRMGRVDLAPVVALALAWCLAELAERGLARLYLRLP